MQQGYICQRLAFYYAHMLNSRGFEAKHSNRTEEEQGEQKRKQKKKRRKNSEEEQPIE